MVGFATSQWGLFRENHGSLLDKFSSAKTAQNCFPSAKIRFADDKCKTIFGGTQKPGCQNRLKS
jgi:hypothetical protein